MITAKLVNVYQIICIKADTTDEQPWHFQTSYSDYSTALFQAKGFAKHYPGNTYYVSMCDPLDAMFNNQPPAEYVP